MESKRASPIYTKLFINNEWVDSVNGATMDVINPATEEKICTISRAGNEDAEKAIKAAREAFDNPKVICLFKYIYFCLLVFHIANRNYIKKKTYTHIYVFFYPRVLGEQ